MSEKPDQQEESLRPGPLVVIAGAGRLPRQIAVEAASHGREVVVLQLRGFARDDFSDFAHHTVDLLNPTHTLILLRAVKAQAVVLAGAVHKPTLGIALSAWQAIHRRDQLRDILRGGDDNLLRGVIKIIEQNGFPVIGIQAAAPRLMAEAGTLTEKTPDAALQADIGIGFDALKAIGGADIGQAVVVAERRILAVEAAEGTDAMIRRVAVLRRAGLLGRLLRRGRPPIAERSGGVLVKASKPGQDPRVDLPVIGPSTIHRAKHAGLAGIAIEAGGVLIVEKQQTLREANKAGLFIVGLAR